MAIGALAGGVAIASTAVPWSRTPSQFQPETRPTGPSGAAGAGPGVLPVPPPRAAAPVESSVPVESAVPALAPSGSTAPTARASPPAPAVWRADGPGAFQRTPWNTVGAAPPQVDGDEVSFLLTDRGQRSELEPALPAVHEGDQHDVTFSVRLDGTFAGGSAARQVIARWENDGPGQAPLDLRVNNGELVLRGGEGHPSGPRTFTRSLGRAPIGEWTQLRVRVRFSANPDKAGVSVWRDGRSVVDDDHPRGGTLYPGQQSYLKVGLHRDRTVTATSMVRFRAWRIDHGHAAAHPDREVPPRDRASAAVHRSTGPSEGEQRSTRSASSDRRLPERSDRDESDRDVARHTRTIQRDTSPHHGPDSRSHRHESEDHPTSGHRSQSGRRSSQHEASARGASEDAGSHRGSSRDGASTNTGVGAGNDSGGRSSEG